MLIEEYYLYFFVSVGAIHSCILNKENILCFNNNSLNFQDILHVLPHRYPFLLIDRILCYKKLKYLYAIKNCTFNEPYFQGHFFHQPIVPGVLIIESMAQASGVLIYKSTGSLDIQNIYYFIGIENARFKKNVIPGDQIILEIQWLKNTKKIQQFKSIARVDKNIVCQAIILFSKK